MSYSAIGFVGLGSYLTQSLSERLRYHTIDPDEDNFTVLLQILREDERKVLIALAETGGRTSQREISRRTGFSRLKTHRVVMRLKERRVVNADRDGRTSIVTLQSWLLRHPKDN